MVKKILLGLFIISNISVGQNFKDALRLSEPSIYSNSRSLSMGNSYVALSSDFAGAVFNPAGLGLAASSTVTGGILINSFNNDANFLNTASSISNNSNSLNQIGIVFPLPTYRGSLVFAVGFHRVKDFNYSLKFDGFNNSSNSLIQSLTSFNDDLAYELKLSYPVFDNEGDYLYDVTKIDGMLNQSGNILDEGKTNAWTFSSAVEIAKNLYAGATLNIYSGDYKREKEFYEDDLQNIYVDPLVEYESTSNFQSFYVKDIIDWDFTGWDFKLGLLFKFDQNVSFGATVKIPAQYTIEETYHQQGKSIFANRVEYVYDPYPSSIEYDISTPMELSGGFSYQLAGLTLSAQANYIDYTQMEFSDGLTAHIRSEINRDINELFRSVFSYNFGVEYKLPIYSASVRGGFFTLPSPYNDDPSDFDKKYITAGFGFVASSVLQIDIAYAYGWWKTFGDNYGFDQSRTFQEINTNNFMLTLTYLMN